MSDITLAALAEQITQLHMQTSRAAAQQINYWLTVRNWLIGWHLTEYEQGGSDRAAYGEQLLPALAQPLRGIKGLAVQRLYDCRSFYRTYPAILQTVSGELQRAGLAGELPVTAPVARPSASGPASRAIASNA